ncbi:hypothetical protein KA005_46340, partial [bacterium]|nr:hypothetical protein [bacterium]
MSGLFSKEVLETQAQVAISNLEPECFKCGLYRYVNTPRMKVSGKGKKKILIVAEANGGDEDRYGTQLVGKTGQFYRKQLAKVGIDLDDDCWKINSVNCRPYTKKGNRKPTKDEIVFCRPMVEKALRELKPEFIWLLGGVALSSFFAKEFSQLQVERWRGLCIPDEKWNAYVLPMYHPSFAMRKERSKNVQSSFMHDLKYAVSCLNKKPFNVHAIRASDIRILTDYHSILSVLDNIIKIEPEFFFFDYETTGKHPFRPGHKIVSMSFAINSQEGVSFPYNHTSIFTTKEKIEMRKRWSSILLNPRIKKTAHNIQFENLWSSVILKTKPVNWHWCTMLTSRCLDNRRGGAGLKYQVYKNFGIRPYDKEIAPYIKGNPFNKIEKAPLKLLLEYGGKDSLYGFRLFEKQREELPDSVENGRQLLTESSIVFSEDTETGMVIDEEYFQKTRDDLLKRIAQMELNLEESKEAQEFKRIHNRL